MRAAIPDDHIARIIPACQRGDAAAVEDLYDLYADRIYRYLLARTGDPDVAADLATDVFLRVIKNIGAFRLNTDRPTASVSAWLYRIAGNIATDYHRARARRLEAPLDEQQDLPAESGDPVQAAEQRESLQELAAAIDALREDQRLVLIGKFGENMSNLQVAQWLDKNEGSVNRHCNTAHCRP